MNAATSPSQNRNLPSSNYCEHSSVTYEKVVGPPSVKQNVTILLPDESPAKGNSGLDDGKFDKVLSFVVTKSVSKDEHPKSDGSTSSGSVFDECCEVTGNSRELSSSHTFSMMPGSFEEVNYLLALTVWLLNNVGEILLGNIRVCYAICGNST